jgi:hypothetical protein
MGELGHEEVLGALDASLLEVVGDLFGLAGGEGAGRNVQRSLGLFAVEIFDLAVQRLEVVVEPGFLGDGLVLLEAGQPLVLQADQQAQGHEHGQKADP